MGEAIWMKRALVLITLTCLHFASAGIAFSLDTNVESRRDNAAQAACRSDILKYDEVKPIVSAHRGRLIRVSGRLTSLVIARDSVTYGITTRDGSLVFVRGSLPAKYTHTGVAVSLITRVPDNTTSLLTLELVEFEQGQGAQAPEVSRFSSSQMNSPQQAQIPYGTVLQSNLQQAQPSLPPNSFVLMGQQNAVPIYSAWGITPTWQIQMAQTAQVPQLGTNVIPQLQPIYAVPATQQRGSLPSRGVNYTEWRSEYTSGVIQPRGANIASSAVEGETIGITELRPMLNSRSISLLEAINAQTQQLLPAYKRAALYFNPSLSDEEATRIVRALLYYSLLYGVDPRFVTAVIAVESSFRPNAVGQKGEMGLGQLMPGTAASLGVSNPFDPEQNIEGCVRLLSRYLASYSHLPADKQIALALACYNAGQNAVTKYGGVPPYPITQRYIKKVTELYRQLCGMR